MPRPPSDVSVEAIQYSSASFSQASGVVRLSPPGALLPPLRTDPRLYSRTSAGVMLPISAWMTCPTFSSIVIFANRSAIRASMDAVMVREQEAMARRMNWLSTTIEGAPYVGLFGTVIGIMLVFVVAAMAGAVDINSVAPGMAAALLCTAAGLGVAIPALFGYNYLGARAEAIGADMAVFIDEFAARLAEEQDGRGPAAVQG